MFKLFCTKITAILDNGTKKLNKFEVITLKAEMYLKLMESWKLSDGTYVLEKKNVSS